MKGSSTKESKEDKGIVAVAMSNIQANSTSKEEISKIVQNKFALIDDPMKLRSKNKNNGTFEFFRNIALFLLIRYLHQQSKDTLPAK